MFLGFPCGSAGKESACNAGDLGLIPRWERFSGEGSGYPLQHSGLENSMGCVVHGVAKSQTGLSDFHSLIYKQIRILYSPSNFKNIRLHFFILLLFIWYNDYTIKKRVVILKIVFSFT